MALALLAPPPAEQTREFPRVLRQPDMAPVQLGTFEEAWAALDRLSRRDDIGIYALALKRGLAAVHNLLRLSEQAETPSRSPELTDEVIGKQKTFASTSAGALLKEADAGILGAPQNTPHKLLMMEAARSMMLVKSVADHGRFAQANSLFAKVQGKIVADLG